MKYSPAPVTAQFDNPHLSLFQALNGFDPQSRVIQFLLEDLVARVIAHGHAPEARRAVPHCAGRAAKLPAPGRGVKRKS